MYIRDARRDRPSENPKADSESRTSDCKRANFGFGEDAAFLGAEFFEKVVVVEAGEDVEEDADEDCDEG